MQVGDRIAALRQEKGITVNKLANMAGVSQSYLRDVELGKKQPTVLYLSYICDALGVRMRDFFSDEPEQPNSDFELMDALRRLTPGQKKTLLAFLNSMRE